MKKLLMATMMLALCTTAHAQWTQTSGPVGGIVYSVATDGDAVIASSQSGLLRYNGAAWTTIDSLEPYDVFAFGNALFVNTLEGELYRSSDGGVNWSNVGLNSILRNMTGSGNDLFTASGQDIFRSTDQGRTWNHSGSVELGYVDQIIATDSGLLVRIYDEFSDPWLALSTDNGQNWREVGEGFPRNAYMSSWTSSGGSVFASLAHHGVYVSNDGGLTWSQTNQGLPTDTNGLYPFGDIQMGAGNVWLGTSRGIYLLETTGWRRLTTEPANSLAIHEGTSTARVIVGSNGGVYKTELPGMNWASLTDATRMQRVDALTRSAASMLAATPGGIYRSTDNGDNWLRTHPYETRAIAMSGIRGVAITGQQESMLYRTTDDGRTWIEGAQGLTEPAGSAGALATAGADIYLGFTDSYTVGGAEGWTTGGVFRSFDGGANWIMASDGLPTREGEYAPVLKLAAWLDNVVAVTVAGVYRSTNKGESWSKMDVELGGHAWNNHVAAWRDTFYLATEYKLYRSARGGAWTPEELVLSNEDTILELAVVDGTPIIVVSHPSSQTMELEFHVYFRGKDGWKRMDDIPEGIRFHRFAGNGEYLFGGTFLHSIWRAPLSLLDGGVSGVEDRSGGSALLASSPNPFRDETLIRFATSAAGRVRLSVVDPLGRQVADLFNGELASGEHQFRLDGRSLAPGAYFYRVEMNGTVSVGKLVKSE